MIINLNDENFEANINSKDNLPVLVDFWSCWCEACRYNAPVADELSTELAGKVKIGKVNVDQCPYTVGRYNLRVLPAMVLFSKGKKVLEFQGVQSKDTILAALKKNLILR